MKTLLVAASLVAFAAPAHARNYNQSTNPSDYGYRELPSYPQQNYNPFPGVPQPYYQPQSQVNCAYGMRCN